MKKEERTIVSVMMDKADDNKLKKYAEENNTTTSRVINSLVRKFIAEKGL